MCIRDRISAGLPEISTLQGVDLILLGNRSGQNLFDVIDVYKRQAADKSTGRLLRTTTRLLPYGQGPRVRTVSKVLRPITIASTLAINSL